MYTWDYGGIIPNFVSTAALSYRWHRVFDIADRDKIHASAWRSVHINDVFVLYAGKRRMFSSIITGR